MSNSQLQNLLCVLPCEVKFMILDQMAESTLRKDLGDDPSNDFGALAETCKDWSMVVAAWKKSKKIAGNLRLHPLLGVVWKEKTVLTADFTTDTASQLGLFHIFTHTHHRTLIKHLLIKASAAQLSTTQGSLQDDIHELHHLESLIFETDTKGALDISSVLERLHVIRCVGSLRVLCTRHSKRIGMEMGAIWQLNERTGRRLHWWGDRKG